MHAQEKPERKTPAGSPQRAAASAGNARAAGSPVSTPGTPSPVTLLALQRAVGNAAVARMVTDLPDSGSPADADQLPVQRSAVHDVLRSPGRPLDEPTRAEMEARLGADFSDVRLHTDSAARRSAAQLGARAYTSGSHVVIGDGGGGRHTLAHELTHVVQQRYGPVAGTDNGDGLAVSDPGDAFERAAEANAHKVMSGRAPEVRHQSSEPTRSATPTLQRAPLDEGSSTETAREGGAVVVVTLSGGVVSRVDIVDRPPHPFPGTHGSHTTAWVVYGDVLRRSVIGLTPENAVIRLRELTDNLGAGTGLQGDRQRDFEAAVARTGQDLGSAGSGDSFRLDKLQDAMTAYLTARNLAPLANVDFGKAQAVGGGEGTARNKLLEHETGQAALDEGELRKAIWALLDVKTLTKMGTLRKQGVRDRLGTLTPSRTPTPGRAGRHVETAFPGRGGRSDAEVAVDIVQRHLADIKAAYPLAFNAANLTAPNVAGRVLEASITGRAADVGELPPEMVTALQGVTVTAASSPQPPQPGTYESSKVAAQIVLAPPSPDGQQTIRDLRVAGRGDTIHGAKQESHVTAHIAIERAVVETVRGKTLPQALGGMIALAKNLPKSPTYPVRTDWGKKVAVEEGEEELEFDQGKVLHNALNALSTQITSAENLVAAGNMAGDPAQTVGLQQLATAYLAARNALPLTSVHTGAPAAGKGEAKHRANLDDLEADLRRSRKVPRPKIREALRGLLDGDAVMHAANDATHLGSVAAYQEPEPATAAAPQATSQHPWRLRHRDPTKRGKAREEDAPDDRVRLDRIAAMIRVHVDTVSTAWPAAAAAAELQTEKGLNAFLATHSKGGGLFKEGDELADMIAEDRKEVVRRVLAPAEQQQPRDTTRPTDQPLSPADLDLGALTIS